MLLCTAMWLMFSHVFNFSDVIIILNRKLPSETDDVLFTQPPPTPPSCYCCSTLGLSTSPSLTRIHVLTPSWNASSLLRPRGRRYVTFCSMTSRARHPPGDCPTRGLWWRHRCGERMGGGGRRGRNYIWGNYKLFYSSFFYSHLSLLLLLNVCLSGLLHLVSFTWHQPCNNQTAL